jgi:hypothetical protein
MLRILSRAAIAIALLSACGDSKTSKLTLVSTTPEQPGANCPGGGVAISSGRDDNNDGTLAPSEIDSTSYVCQPVGAPAQLVRVDDEPEGANCAHGGSAIRSGADTNGNASLEDSEVTSTSYVCNGTGGVTGATSLIRVTVEPPSGGHCAAGGQALESGIDLNANGTLDDAEVTNTAYVCGDLDGTGTATLIRVDAEPAGAHCAAGGQALKTGADTDGDSTLDDAEVATISYVCKGTNGTNGVSSLIRFDAEPAGSHCTYGGQAIKSGLDANANATLDAAEVATTSYVCAGAPGASTLIRVTTEPVGTNCANGGQALQTGVDANGNSTLDTAEVSATSYVCAGVDGDDGSSGTLVRVDVEPAGTNCSSGGQAIKTGYDLNASSTLDSAEVVTTSYVCSGTNGTNGTNGTTSLVKIVVEPSGAHCTAGGQAIQTGIDTNGNSMLDALEVTTIAYVCSGVAGTNGTNGTNGLTTLVRVDAEPIGNHCAAGGQAINTGIDLDADTVLDTLEIASTSYVCNGASNQSLFRIDPEPKGTNCPAGGNAIRVGLDINSDGALATSEVQSTTFLCHPTSPTTVEGSVFVHNSIDAEALIGVQHITGNLTIDAFGLTTIDLSSLQDVGGTFSVANFSGTSLTAPALVEVGGAFVSTANAAISVPVLESIGTYLYVMNARSLSAPVLLSATDSVQISIGGAGTVDLHALTTTNYVTVSSTDPATTFDLSALTATSYLHLGTGMLKAPALANVTGSAEFYGDATFDLGALAHVQHLTLSGLSDTPTFPALATLDGNLSIYGLTASTVDLSDLASAGGVYIQNNSNLSSVDLSLLVTASELHLSNNANLSLAVPSLTTLSGLYISNEPNPTTLPALTSVVNLQLTNTLPATLSFPELTTASSQLYVANTALATLSLPKLATLGRATIYSSPNLALSLPLVTTTTTVEVQYSLQSLSMANLATVDYISLYSTSLSALAFPSLTRVRNQFYVDTSPALTTITLPALTTVDYYFQIYNSAALTAIDAPLLTTIGNRLQLTNNANLTSFNAPLTAHLQYLYITGDPKFPYCRAEQLRIATTATSWGLTGLDTTATCP